MNKNLLYQRCLPQMPLILVILTCVVIRIMSGTQWFTLVDITMELDKASEMIYRHLWQSVLFQHSTPPLGTLVNGLVYPLGKPLSYFAMIGLHLVIAGTAAGALFLSCRALNVGTGISAGLTVGYSIAMMRVRQGFYWFQADDLAYLFLPLFVWNLIMRVKDPSKRHDLYLGLLSGLMLWTSPVPGVVGLLITMVMVLVQRPSKPLVRRLAAVLVPLVLLFLLCFKNYYSVGVFNICTKGGLNGMQLTLLVNAWPPEKLFEFVKNEVHPPTWWQWCYSQGKYNVENLYGRCYGEYAAPNYEPLYQSVSAAGDKKLAQRVLDDAMDDINRPWIFYLPSGPELNRRFSAHYNVESQKVWTTFMLKRPVTFIYGVINDTNKFFMYDGPLFGFNQGDYKGTKIFDAITRVVSFCMLPVFYGGTGVAYLAFLAFLVALFRNWKAPFSAPHVLALGFVASNFLFVIATCCENSRYYWMAVPYSLPLAAFGIEALVGQARKLRNS